MVTTLDPNSAGTETQVHDFSYDWKDLCLYALGIGATRDELDYLYEARGPKVYPTFAVVPAYPVMNELLQLSKGPYSSVVHAAQTIRALKPIPATGTLKTQGRIAGVYDMKRMALLHLETTTRLDQEVVFESEWQILMRGEGGFGGPRRPRSKPTPLPKRDPDWTYQDSVSPTGALLYRLSGDHNPLHADPDFAASVGFEQGPILHGLATMGYICRAVALKSCDGDASRITELSTQFKKPVWPGESLRTEGFVEGDELLLQAFASNRSDAVVGGAKAIVTP